MNRCGRHRELHYVVKYVFGICIVINVLMVVKCLAYAKTGYRYYLFIITFSIYGNHCFLDNVMIMVKKNIFH